MIDIGLAQDILYPLITIEFVILFVMYAFFNSRILHTAVLDVFLGAFLAFNAISYFLYTFESSSGIIEIVGFYIDVIVALIGAIYVMNITKHAHKE